MFDAIQCILTHFNTLQCILTHSSHFYAFNAIQLTFTHFYALLGILTQSNAFFPKFLGQKISKPQFTKMATFVANQKKSKKDLSEDKKK